MFRIHSTALIGCLLASWLVAELITHSCVAQELIPQTPAGERLSELLDHVNSDNETRRNDFLKQGFLENDESSVSRRIRQTDQVRQQFGHIKARRVVQSDPSRIEVSCSTEQGVELLLTIQVADQKPFLIQSVAVELGNSDSESEPIALDAESRQQLIEVLCRELRAKYVFPETGEKMAESLTQSLAEGEYDQYIVASEMARQLTEQLQSICHDKHLRVRPGSPRRPSTSPGRRQIDNHGFVKVEMLPGGVGYLKFNYFSGDKAAQKTAAAAMNFLGNATALIFDVRENGGGSPEMIAFLSSYLFDNPVHLNSFYNRPTDTTTEKWTQAEVPGEKFGEQIPVYVLTSNYTFSGAEEFSYNLKHLQRGTIVGETTGGGAHPVMPVRLGKWMHITMPFARAINPVTETNWEGVGVKPHIQVAADKALKKALELARNPVRQAQSSDPTPTEQTQTSDVDTDQLRDQISDLMSSQQFDEAAKVLARLTKLEPNDGAAWFRYGYCLHAARKLDQAIKVHQKAAEFEQFAPIATYNLACAYALQEKTEPALKALARAVELGFGDAEQMEQDSDLDSLREQDQFRELLNRLKSDR